MTSDENANMDYDTDSDVEIVDENAIEDTATDSNVIVGGLRGERTNTPGDSDSDVEFIGEHINLNYDSGCDVEVLDEDAIRDPATDSDVIEGGVRGERTNTSADSDSDVEFIGEHINLNYDSGGNVEVLDEDAIVDPATDGDVIDGGVRGERTNTSADSDSDVFA